jgi:uncharacterized membrane protein HdeD (DUF308 family)
VSTRDVSYDDAAELANVAKRWWLFLLSGILWILFAFVVLTFDLTTVWAVAVFFGIGLIAGGVTELVVASQAPSWKWLHVLVGVISIVAGLVALAWPGQTFLVLAAVIGWYLLFAGLFDVVAAFATKDENEIWWLQLILGITQILIGFWAVGYAGRSIAVLVIWVGAAALSRGISSLFLAFGLRKAGKELHRLNPA